MNITTSVVLPCGGPKKSPRTLYIDLVLLYLHFLVLWDCGIHNFLESSVALNPGLGGVRDILPVIISHKQTMRQCMKGQGRICLVYKTGDVPRRPSYLVFISQLIRLARVCSHVEEFNARHKCLTAKLLKQGYR